MKGTVSVNQLLVHGHPLFAATPFFVSDVPYTKVPHH
jgi:hypothetical protein